MNLRFNWQRNMGQWSFGESLYLGKIKVANCCYNIAATKDSADKSKDYVGHVLLPASKVDMYGATLDSVKDKIEAFVIKWFNEALKDS